jgi:hypothetical protein
VVIPYIIIVSISVVREGEVATWVVLKVRVRGGHNTPSYIMTSSIRISTTLSTVAIAITFTGLIDLT